MSEEEYPLTNIETSLDNGAPRRPRCRCSSRSAPASFTDNGIAEQTALADNAIDMTLVNPVASVPGLEQQATPLGYKYCLPRPPAHEYQNFALGFCGSIFSDEGNLPNISPDPTLVMYNELTPVPSDNLPPQFQDYEMVPNDVPADPVYAEVNIQPMHFSILRNGK